MEQRIKEHFYEGDTSDLRQLMYEVGAWAQNWDDVRWYLKTVAPHNTVFTRWDLASLEGYVGRLEHTGARFTTDYREMFRELTGRELPDAPAPDEARFQRHPLRKIAEKWLVGLRFPASKEDVLQRARANHAPEDILTALAGLAKPRYPNMGALLHEVSELGAGRA